MKCLICNREAMVGECCEMHAKAYRKITVTYDRWKRALDISWKEYLSEIAENPLTGEWTRKLAEELVKAEKETDVESS